MAGKKSFEEKMIRLEEIVTLLEKGDASLEESLKLFQEGTKLAADCRKELRNAEQQVVELMRNDDRAPVETEFISED